MVSMTAHLDLATVGSVCQGTSTRKQNHDTDHDTRQDSWEPVGLLHRLGDRNDQSDAFEREHGSSTGEVAVRLSGL